MITCLIPGKGVLHPKLMVLQLVKILPILNGAKMFISVFTREGNWSLSRYT
jgi:hypothetical protein